MKCCRYVDRYDDMVAKKKKKREMRVVKCHTV